MSFDTMFGAQYQLLRPEGSCHTCPRAKKDFVPATRKGNGLLVMGEAPGAVEVERGDGWRGKAGTFMRDVLREEAGVAEFDYTNALHCRPPGNKTPNVRELRCCLNQYVKEEVRGYPLVVLAGNVAVSSLYPGVNAQKLRGSVAFHPDYPGQRFYTMYHPAYALRDARGRRRFVEQVQRLGRILKEPHDTPWRLVTSRDADAWERFRAVLDSGFVSFDYETDGVDAWDPSTRILSLAVAHTERESVFWHHTDPGWEDALSAVCDFLGDPANFVLGHNIGFDVVMAERRSSGRRRLARCTVGDTMHLLYLARQDKQVGLKQAWARYGDGYRFLVTHPHRCEDVTQLGPYNSEDTVRPLQLFDQFYHDLPAKTKDLFWTASSPAGLVLSRVSADGFRYDADRGRELLAYTRELRDEALAAWRAEDPRLSLWYDEDGKAQGDHSGEGLRTYVYGSEFLGLPVGATTDTGKPSVDKDALKGLVRDHPQARPLQHLLTIKQLNKQEETYVEPYLKGDNVSPDGRCHSSYTACYTDTGRPSSRKPNMQNITRPKREWRINLRDCFVPRDGCTLVEWDLSQIELRLAMCISGDPAGIAAYQSGSDLHTATGAAIARLAGRDTPTEEDRQNAKGVNFGAIYGAQWPTVQRYAWSTYGVRFTDKEAEAFTEGFFATYRHLRPWHAREIQKLRDGGGELTSVLGHTAYYGDWDSSDQGAREHAERAAINMTCQGTAAYIMLRILYLTQQAVYDLPHLDVLWTNTVYDSMLADMPAEQIPEVQEIVDASVARTHEWIRDWFVVPLVIDRKEGPDWGHLRELE